MATLRDNAVTHLCWDTKCLRERGRCRSTAQGVIIREGGSVRTLHLLFHFTDAIGDVFEIVQDLVCFVVYGVLR